MKQIFRLTLAAFLSLASIAYPYTLSGGGATAATPVPPTPAPTSTPLAFGTPGVVAIFGSPELQPYAGTGPVTGKVISALDATGAGTFVDAGSTNITNVTGGVFLIPNKSSTGTTINHIAKLDTTASPATAIIATTADTVNLLGVVVSGAGTTGNATILSVGQAPCQFDGTATVGHYVVASTTTNGDCNDSGSATIYPTGVAVLGIVAESGTNASPRQVDFNTPDVASASAGPNGKGVSLQVNGTNTKVIANINGTTPAATGNNINATCQSSNSGNTTSISCQVDPSATVNFAYSGTLKITDKTTNSSGFTVAHRYHGVTTGSSAITATLPASSGGGVVYDICKVDSGSGTVVITRAGSDVILNSSTGSANTVTLTGQGRCETLYDQASASWVGRGDGT